MPIEVPTTFTGYLPDHLKALEEKYDYNRNGHWWTLMQHDARIKRCVDLMWDYAAHFRDRVPGYGPTLYENVRISETHYWFMSGGGPSFSSSYAMKYPLKTCLETLSEDIKSHWDNMLRRIDHFNALHERFTDIVRAIDEVAPATSPRVSWQEFSDIKIQLYEYLPVRRPSLDRLTSGSYRRRYQAMQEFDGRVPRAIGDINMVIRYHEQNLPVYHELMGRIIERVLHP